MLVTFLPFAIIAYLIVLGASSGFGGTVANRLAKEGMNLFGVHLDRKATLPNDEKIQEVIGELILEKGSKRINDDTLLVVNPAGLKKQYAQNMEYLDDIGQSPYGKWFEKLNAKAAAKVTSAIDRIGTRAPMMGEVFGSAGYRTSVFVANPHIRPEIGYGRFASTSGL